MEEFNDLVARFLEEETPLYESIEAGDRSYEVATSYSQESIDRAEEKAQEFLDSY